MKDGKINFWRIYKKTVILAEYFLKKLDFYALE